MSAAPTIAPPAPDPLKMPAGPDIAPSSTTPTGPSQRSSRAGTSSEDRSAGGSTSTGAGAGNGPRLEPSFRGILDSTYDALLLFEASRRGMIPRIRRRLAEKQRAELIQSGSIFIFEEEESGIKRWTDGLIWSPSRILGNYLVYRQTEQRNSRGPRSGSTSKGFRKKTVKAPPTPTSPPSDDRRKLSSAAKPDVKKEPLVRPSGGAGRKSFSSTPAGLDPASLLGLSAAPEPEGGKGSLFHEYFPPQQTQDGKGTGDGNDDLLMEMSDEEEVRDLEELIRIKERSLVGSLTNSYAFKEGGLVKRTMSMVIDGRTQHLVSYYSLADGMTDEFRTPSTLPEFADLEIDPQLLMKAQFRFPPKVEQGPDGVLRYVSEADTSQSPKSESPATLSNDIAQPPSPHPYYNHSHGMLSSSYPATGMAGLPTIDTNYKGGTYFSRYDMNGPSGNDSIIGYGAPSHSTYSAPEPAPHQWSSSLPKEFSHPAVLASPFPRYQPLPLPPPSQHTAPTTQRTNSSSRTSKASKSEKSGPQRRRRASQTSVTASTILPEGRQLVLTDSPFGQPNRPLAGGKPGFHPYAMPSPTEGWTAYHPSSTRSPQHTGSSTRSSYFDGEPSVFAAGPLSSAIASTPSSAGSSLSAGSGGGASLQLQQQYAASTLTPAMRTSALGPPVGSAGKRLSLSFGRDKTHNSPRRHRSPSMQPSPLRSSAPLPLYTGEADLFNRSSFPQHGITMPQYSSPTTYATVAPHEMQGSGPEPTFNTSWNSAPQALHHPYATEYYDAPPDASPHHSLSAHYGQRSSPPQPSNSFYSASSLLLQPPMTTFADDKRSATLALDQLHFGSVGGGPGDSIIGGREYQIPSGMVAADDRRPSFSDYSLQPAPNSPEHVELPGPQYWAA